jgi:8-oxo-dGTP diphosphatase
MTPKIQLAGCVILDEYGGILLLHRSVAERTQWELPGGKVEPGEAPEQAAIREIDEELGVEVRLTKVLGSGEFEEGDAEYQYVWFQAVVTQADPMLHETDKFDDLDYFDIEDLPELALSANLHVLFEKIISGDMALEV